MKTEKVIIIKKRGGTGGRRRGPLRSVPGNRNLDRRRFTASDVRPTWLWDAGLSQSSGNIFFPYVGTFGSFRGSWWRKDGDVLVMAYYTEGTATFDGTWTEAPGSPYPALDGEVRLYYREWNQGDPETLSFTADAYTTGFLQAWRNVDATNIFETVSTSVQTAQILDVPAITVPPKGALFGAIFQRSFDNPHTSNITNATSTKLDYLSRYWDTNSTTGTANNGMVSGSVQKTTLVDDLEITTEENKQAFILASAMPAIKPTRATVGQYFRTSLIEPYYTNNLTGAQSIVNAGDTVVAILRNGQDTTPYSTWRLETLPNSFNGFSVTIATKTIKTSDETIADFDLLLKSVNSNPTLLSIDDGTGTSALSSSTTIADGLLTVGVALSNSSFFPQPTVSGLSEWSSENGISSIYIITGYGDGTAGTITYPISTASDWLTFRLGFKRRR